MSETTPEINTMTNPAAQELSQSPATTTLDAVSSSSPPVEQEPAGTTTGTSRLGSSSAVVDSDVVISDSEPVITDGERASEQAILTEQTLSTAATSIVALEQPSTTPGVPTSEPGTLQVKPTSTAATQEATPVPMDSLPPPENVAAESAMSTTTTHSQQTPVDPRPVETATVPAMTTTSAVQSQPAKEITKVQEPKEKAEPSVEPQNKLTNKFTEAEWKALKEFRVQLPDIFAEAYPDRPKARETPLTLWGVTLDPANPQSDARVSVILMKFLRARHLGVREARAMLVNTLRWREEFDVNTALAEDYPKEIFGNVGYIYGRDKERRPVIYNVYGGHRDLKAVFGDVKRFLRWRVALMEKSVAQLDFNEVDQTVQIHDYAGLSLSSRDANAKAAANEASNIFQSHYPELLYKKFFVNVPTVLAWIYWAFKPLVSAETLAKMSVVGTGKSNVRKALLPYINVEEIPTRYGGEAEAF